MLVRLWVHECMRVFSDRLINEDDKKLFVDVIKEAVVHTDPQTKYLFEKGDSSVSIL